MPNMDGKSDTFYKIVHNKINLFVVNRVFLLRIAVNVGDNIVFDDYLMTVTHFKTMIIKWKYSRLIYITHAIYRSKLTCVTKLSS